MKHILLLLLLLFVQSKVHAQKEANNWYFGTKNGFNFSNGYPETLADGAMKTYGGSAVISDRKTGELLFYTNGRTIWNSRHQPMPNGGYNPVDCANGISQPALIVPVPDSEHLYYVFTLYFKTYPGGEPIEICSSIPWRPYSMDVKYSVEDMRLNEGLGDVSASQKDLLLQSNATEKLTAVPHNNGRDFWLLTHERDSDAFYNFLISPDGISSPSVQHIGSTHQYLNNDSQGMRGLMKASPDGRKLAVAVHRFGSSSPFDLFNYDAATGTLSNYVNLGNLRSQYGASFSPDNSKLYAISESHSDLGFYPDNIVQYDLTAGNFEAVIASAQSIIIGNPSVNRPKERYLDTFIDMQLAPDGKIYIAGSNMHVDKPEYADNYAMVIHDPNRKGFDSEISYTTFDFNGEATIDTGLPNFIQSYFNGLEPVEGEQQECRLAVGVYPNPTTGTVKFMRDGDCGDTGAFSLRIVNSIGQIVRKELTGLTLENEVDISGYTAGMYVFILSLPGNQQVVKKVVKINQ